MASNRKNAPGARMNRIALAVLSSLLTLLATEGCTPAAKAAAPPSTESEAGKATAPEAEAGKVTAPVAVEAQMGDGKAHVTVRFASPASDVKIGVYGVDGLAVKSAAQPVEGQAFAATSTTSFDVTFTPGPGRSHLVVSVSGSFNGAARAKVSSFAVGTPSAAQQQTGNVVVGEDGVPIKLMPVNNGTK
jgi:hypothetical protein